MKKREQLEKAGWVYLDSFGGLLIFGRVDKRILYNSENDNVYATYSVRELELHPFCEYQFNELLK